MNPEDWIARALSGAIIVNTGQLQKADTKALDREVRRGALVKWRGYWHPIAGAAWGIGPLKTCYGTPAAKAAVN
jgi:hypothetical protein